jgi:hypothetical protein
MKWIFKQAGGVPRKIRIDNMTITVRSPKTKFDPPKLTDAFI